MQEYLHEHRQDRFLTFCCHPQRKTTRREKQSKELRAQQKPSIFLIPSDDSLDMIPAFPQPLFVKVSRRNAGMSVVLDRERFIQKDEKLYQHCDAEEQLVVHTALRSIILKLGLRGQAIQVNRRQNMILQAEEYLWLGISSNGSCKPNQVPQQPCSRICIRTSQ